MRKTLEDYPAPHPLLTDTLAKLQVEIGIVAFGRAMESGRRERDTLDDEVQKLIKEIATWLEESSRFAMQEANQDLDKLSKTPWRPD